MYKPFIIFALILILASFLFYLIIGVVLDHEARQGEQDIELQIQAATWRLEL